MRALALLLAVSAAQAAGPGFAGRWNIRLHGPAPEGSPAAWWLEVTRDESGRLGGRFVGAWGGDCDRLEDLTIDGAELRFSFFRRYHLKPGAERTPARGVYRARLLGERLEGDFSVEGQDAVPLRWTGVRAPDLQDRDDGSWIDGEPIELFNRRDLDGWQPLESGRASSWAVNNAILGSRPYTVNLISRRKFWNFHARMEYRLPPRANSGLGLRGRYEIQIADSFGRPPGVHTHGAVYGHIAPAEEASLPAGEWQALEARLVGRTVTVTLNGRRVIDRQIIDGPTAIAFDPDEAAAGPIYLQGDHRAIEIRRLTVTPLVRKENTP